MMGAAIGDDIGDGMQCGDHPYGSNPGGICAFCLQEKLGKLVSSSAFAGPFLPAPLLPNSSSSSAASPASARSVSATSRGGSGFLASKVAAAANVESSGRRPTGGARSVIPFLHTTHGLVKKKKSGCGGGGVGVNGRWKVASSSAAGARGGGATAFANGGGGFIFKRSKSVAPRPINGNPGDCTSRIAAAGEPLNSPRKRWFWSFLHHSSYHQHHHHNHNRPESDRSSNCVGKRDPIDLKSKQQQQTTTVGSSAPSKEEGRMPNKDNPPPAAAAVAAALAAAIAEEDEDEDGTSLGTQKVGRSRSVGCGSRSFSSDFLERISTGFGDCTLRRVESQREAKPHNTNNSKIALHRFSTSAAADNAADHRQKNHHNQQQQRVRCGGIFGGFGIISSSFSSSYWFPEELCSSRASISTTDGAGMGTPRSRARGWNWAFGGRASRPSSKPCNTAATDAGSRDVPTTVHAAATDAGSATSANTSAAVSSMVAVKG